MVPSSPTYDIIKYQSLTCKIYDDILESHTITCMHCKGNLEAGLAFEELTSFKHLPFSVVICVCLSVVQGEVRLLGGER